MHPGHLEWMVHCSWPEEYQCPCITMYQVTHSNPQPRRQRRSFIGSLSSPVASSDVDTGAEQTRFSSSWSWWLVSANKCYLWHNIFSSSTHEAGKPWQTWLTHRREHLQNGILIVSLARLMDKSGLKINMRLDHWHRHNCKILMNMITFTNFRS